LQNPAAATFGSLAQLEDVLGRIRDEWLPRYVLPLLGDPERLGSALVEQEQELQAEHDNLVARQLLLKARRLFDEGDFPGAAETYALVGIDALSAGDQRRYYAARRGGTS
jgi:hypothetical protein